uniref:copper transporter 5.1-like n=1 Tax=Erigeron canadensis TaxID=72917 RepID=UPI001CB9022E|nr:copper transporter 5.1-like [Erigeron canadensis]
MMHMTFYWSRNVTLLFDSWKTNSWLSYILSLAICIIFSIFYQYMEDKRVRFKLLASTKTKTDSPSDTTTSPLLLNKKIKIGGGCGERLMGSVLFGVNSAIGYFLMLSIMSFNGGVFVAIVVGLSVGYFLFRSGGEIDDQVVDNPCACA